MFARKPRLVIASLAVATLVTAAPLGRAASVHAAVVKDDLPIGVTLDSLSPDTVTASSGVQITIQCLEGCDAAATISVGGIDLSGGQISYDASADTETFTLPDALQPGTYDVTVSEPNGTTDTLEGALTVDGPPDVSLASLSPDTVVAGSGAQITIACNQGCDDYASVSVGDADITEESVTYDAQSNTETFTLPDTVDAGTYDVTVTEPDGRAATLANALTVEAPLTLAARVVNPTVHPGGTVRMLVRTNAEPNNWGASIYSAGWRALPHVQIDYKDKGNGTWRVSFQLNKHVAPGRKQIVLTADMGSQHLSQTYTICVVR